MAGSACNRTDRSSYHATGHRKSLGLARPFAPIIHKRAQKSMFEKPCVNWFREQQLLWRKGTAIYGQILQRTNLDITNTINTHQWVPGQEVQNVLHTPPVYSLGILQTHPHWSASLAANWTCRMEESGDTVLLCIKTGCTDAGVTSKFI